VSSFRVEWEARVGVRVIGGLIHTCGLVSLMDVCINGRSSGDVAAACVAGKGLW
jgi:hypothetical protein